MGSWYVSIVAVVFTIATIIVNCYAQYKDQGITYKSFALTDEKASLITHPMNNFATNYNSNDTATLE